MATCQMPRDEVIAFIKRQGAAIIASIDESGQPKVRAIIKPRKMIGNYIYYFPAKTSSRRVKLFRQNADASIYFYHRGAFCCTGIMFKGKMEILQDTEIKEELWRSFDRIFFRKGVTDPNYCVLKFTAVEGRMHRQMRKGNLIVS